MGKSLDAADRLRAAVGFVKAPARPTRSDKVPAGGGLRISRRNTSGQRRWVRESWAKKKGGDEAALLLIELTQRVLKWTLERSTPSSRRTWAVSLSRSSIAETTLAKSSMSELDMPSASALSWSTLRVSLREILKRLEVQREPDAVAGGRRRRRPCRSDRAPGFSRWRRRTTCRRRSRRA